jgi:hypothetical protein
MGALQGVLTLEHETLEGSGAPISLHKSDHGDQDLRCELPVVDGTFALLTLHRTLLMR